MVLKKSWRGFLLLPFLFLMACAQGGSGSASDGSNNTATSADPIAGTNGCGAMNSQECAVIDLVNTERAKQSLASLKPLPACVAEAQSHAADMVTRNFFSHDSPSETSTQRFQRFGVAFGYYGENIALGYSSPEAVMSGWMNSPGHKANILGANFHSMGVGLATNSSGVMYWVQCFSSQNP
ncbi:CAP domain-containing protein [Bdellovibrio sp. NC01]|uniref:CAP domain-containing protein n=1 Tax=Bdellovibrio sp. NC01 TaxID=2220073 RepID=UPI001158CABC|nr:CAP domain-containing protein [Bdellovibrio sp. NC01]QDK38221.1 CAP domain-containing protein [Bdellovibrio sp. NC01]